MSYNNDQFSFKPFISPIYHMHSTHVSAQFSIRIVRVVLLSSNILWVLNVG